VNPLSIFFDFVLLAVTMLYHSDFLFALGTGVVAVDDPFLDALEAVDMCTVVEGCKYAGAYFFNAYDARL